MRGAGWVNHQAAAIAHIGQVAEDLERFYESATLCACALDVKAEHRACAFGQQLLRQHVAGVGGQHGVAHAAHQRVLGQKLHHRLRVAHVPRHAQGQGFDALQNQPSGVRAHARAKVAQALAPRTQQKRTHRGFFGKHHVVKASVRLGEFGEFVIRSPVKTAAVNHHTANHRAVATQKFGGGVHHQISAQLQGFHQPRWRQRRIHQQGHTGLMRNAAHLRDVQHIHARVAHGLAEKQFGVGAHRSTPSI